jgi:hypothetical protein
MNEDTLDIFKQIGTGIMAGIVMFVLASLLTLGGNESTNTLTKVGYNASDVLTFCRIHKTNYYEFLRSKVLKDKYKKWSKE